MNDDDKRHVYENKRQERALTIMQVVSFIITLVILALAVIYFAVFTDTSAGVNQIKESNEFAACKDEIALDVISASSDIESSMAMLNLVTNVGLEASVSGNDEVLSAAIEASGDARMNVLSDINNLNEVIQESQRLSNLSIDDPEEFLRVCNE